MNFILLKYVIYSDNTIAIEFNNYFFNVLNLRVNIDKFISNFIKELREYIIRNLCL